MAYTVEPVDVLKTPKERVIDPRSKKSSKENPSKYKWWLSQSDRDLATQLLSTTEYLKKNSQQRIRQASIFTRLFSGKPLYNYLASTSTLDNSNQLPIGRPTANVSYSCVDTLTSRITLDKPQPTFLTEGGHYRQRKVAKEANQFIMGEFYRLKAYELMALMMRDSCVLGTGFLKVFAQDGKSCIQRTLETELLLDYNDSYYGDPRELIQMKLVDRSVYMELFPESADKIASASQGNVDNSPKSTDTVSDQFIIAEGWHLPSNKGSGDGRHTIVCSEGIISDGGYEKSRFPFVRLNYNPNIVGWMGQGLIEILMPTQMEIYRQLIVASQSLELMGVPRVLMEEFSKILETSFNNRIGTIIKYRKTPPEFVNAMANNPEVYTFIQWLIQNAYNMAGISALSAQGQKPQGLNSGEAIREYEGVQDSRFAALSKRYQDCFPDLADLIIDTTKDIVDETGKPYKTLYAGKDGTHEIDFKSISALKDTYVIQCFEQSSLPKDPAGRQAKISEMFAANEISRQEFRRLSNFPDLEQSDQLAVALEERILNNLDAIVEEGEKGYCAPDPFLLDPSDMATTLTVNYINKYAVTDIEKDKLDLLRTYFTAVQDLKQQAMPPPPIEQPAEGGQQLPIQPPQPSVSPTSNVQV